MQPYLVLCFVAIFSAEFANGQNKNNKGKQKKSSVVCSEDTYFQHADTDDCTKFYKCDSSMKPVQFSCPSGLHYNAKTHNCDWPKDAGCEKSTKKKSKNPVECPTVKSGTTTRVKNPKDNKSYYVCDSKGTATLKECATGTVYEEATKKCRTEKSDTQDNQSKKSQNSGNNDNDEDYNWDNHW